MTGRDLPTDHDQFAFDDAAYVLGGLAPADRAAFEAHLAGCPLCSDSVAELARLPILLARVEPAALEVEPPPPTLLPRLLDEVGRQRSRRSWRTAAIGFAAACVLALLVGGGTWWYSSAHQPQALALHAVGPNQSGVQATVKLLGSGQTTRIQLDCGYRDPAGRSYPAGGPSPSYRMVVYNRLGVMRDLGSWTPQPGEDVRIVRNSPWSKQALSRIEIADGHGVVLLSLTL